MKISNVIKALLQNILASDTEANPYCYKKLLGTIQPALKVIQAH